MKLSVVISARNEFPSIVHTVHAIINDLETFLAQDDFEIIIVDNLSDDERLIDQGKTGTVEFLRTRGAYTRGILRVLYDPIAGNVSARNKGARVARGEYLFFSDAHMSYRIGSFQRMVEAIDESHGIVHPAIAWMGSYPPETVYQYSWRLGREFDGAWNESKVSAEWFYVPAMGHCCLGMRRDQFLAYRGYPEYLRCYGGGGMFLDTKWWMLGSPVVTEPRAIGYHLSAGRGYSYATNDYIHNIFHSALCLGADAWAERVYLNYLRSMTDDALAQLWREAEAEALDQRAFITQRRQISFDELIVQRPWDALNDIRVGSHSSGLTIGDRKWLEAVKGTAAERVYPGKYQRYLEELIDVHLSAFTSDGDYT